MSGLLPTGTDASSEQTGELRTLWLDSDDAGELLSSLSSETARAVLSTLHEQPATASEVSNRVETSLQNARHHLTNLQDAGLVRVADTRYSQKGREMNVYAPSEEPMVVFVGREEQEDGFLSSLKGLVSAVAVLGVVSLLIEWAVTLGSETAAVDIPRISDGVAGSGGGGTALVMQPGVVFFAGGLLVLGLLLAYRRWNATNSTVPS